VLSEYGNLAAATILFVVKQFLAQPNLPRAGARGLFAGFGPGFTTEMALLTWS
jgi:1,3,6,8-tetrahydroxynaphthalene synthase